MDQIVESNLPADRRAPGRPGLIIGGGIGLVGIAAIAVWIATRGPAGSALSSGPDKPLVTVLSPALEQVDSTVSLTGLINARNEVPIGNEGDSARVTEVLVEPGAHVRQGQVLARLSPIAAQSLVDMGEAALDQAKADAAIAQAEWTRAQQGPDLFSKEETDRRRTTAISTQAKVKSAAAQVTDARNKLAHTVIVAPADGTVLSRTAEVGQFAVPGVTVLFHLARDGQIEMRGQVAEVDVPRLAVDQKAIVHLDGVSHAFTGTVWQIGAVIDPTTRQGTVRVSLPADRDLRPGAFARADIAVGKASGVLLPPTAVLSDGAGSYVLLVGADNKVERRTVRVAGQRPEGLLISDGLQGTERVVAIAGAFLRPGESVAVAPRAAVVAP
jgi:RND family efflux transporter MFP subunit